MTKVILVRHGQTAWNVAMKYQGQTDIALDDLGIRQAHWVAERLAVEAVHAVYASDLRRALHTADIIAERHRLLVTPVPDLREIDFGDWEGLQYQAIRESWSDTFKRLFTHPDTVDIPGGESFPILQRRCAKAVQALVRRHANETIVIVSHGGSIRTILCTALDIPLRSVWNIKQDNTAVSIVEYCDERAVVTLMNDAHHVKE